MPSILTIPSSNIYGDNKEFFSFSFIQKNNRITVHDVCVDISKNLRPNLEGLARLMNIPGISKLKKAELVKLVADNIRFE